MWLASIGCPDVTARTSARMRSCHSARGLGDRAPRSAPWRWSRGRPRGRSRGCRSSCSSDIGAPLSGCLAEARRARRSVPSRPSLRRRARMVATALRRRRPPRRRRSLPGTHIQFGNPSKAAATSHEMVASVASAACMMAAASWSALPANMVAEMTWKVVSVMSRSMACMVPAGARRQRSIWSCAAAVMAGTSPARSAGRNSGAAVRLCQRQLAPCEVRMPSPSVSLQDLLLQRRLGETLGILQQHALDQRGIGDVGDDVAAAAVDEIGCS